MKTKSPLNRKVQFAFASAILTLLVVGAISYRGMILSSESARLVRHTHEVLENIQDLRLAWGSIAADSRGFVLTGQESYLEANRASVLRVKKDQTTIGKLTADNPEQQRQLPALESLISQRIRRAEIVIGLRRTQGLAAAADAIGSGTEDLITVQFHAVADKLQSEEMRLLVRRDADMRRRLRQNKTGLIFGAALGLLIACVAAWSAQHDSSARGQAEKALQESEENYRMLLDGVQDYAIFMLDARGQVVSWNAGAERIKGYTAEQIIGHNFSCFFPKEDIELGRPEEVLRLTAASGRHEEHGMRVRKDGSQFLADVIFTALRDPPGNLRGFSEISRDLSENQESEARYRGLLEAAPDAMVVVNEGGEIVLLNLQAERQFGYRRDELVGQKVRNVIPEGFAERLVADESRTAAEALAQQIGTGIELYGRRKDGSDFPIEIMLSPLENAEGILVTAAIRDITVRKEAESQLRQTRKMESIGQFAGGMAHDFNNLLGVILGYCEILEKRLDLAEPARKMVEEIQKAGISAKNLTRPLLAFSRRQVMQPVFLDLNAAVQRVDGMLDRMIGESVEMVSVLDRDLGTIRSDPSQIEQVLMNLVLNARDAMPNGGKIIIQTSNVEIDEAYARQRSGAKPGPYVMLSVSDTGTGMDKETQSRIFEPFFSTKGAGKGTGLGLSTVFGIVMQSGGSIGVYSELGHGTTFKIHFPRCNEPPVVLPPQESAPLRGGSETILLVDDFTLLRKLTRRLLEDCGYTVLDSGDPAEALRIAEQHTGPLPLMITDVVMPGFSGTVLAERVAVVRPETKVLYTSGYANNEIVQERALGPGCGFLEKPFTRDDLVRRVRDLLDSTIHQSSDLPLCANGNRGPCDGSRTATVGTRARTRSGSGHSKGTLGYGLESD